MPPTGQSWSRLDLRPPHTWAQNPGGGRLFRSVKCTVTCLPRPCLLWPRLPVCPALLLRQILCPSSQTGPFTCPRAHLEAPRLRPSPSQSRPPPITQPQGRPPYVPRGLGCPPPPVRPSVRPGAPLRASPSAARSPAFPGVCPPSRRPLRGGEMQFRSEVELGQRLHHDWVGLRIRIRTGRVSSSSHSLGGARSPVRVPRPPAVEVSHYLPGEFPACPTVPLRR